MNELTCHIVSQSSFSGWDEYISGIFSMLNDRSGIGTLVHKCATAGDALECLLSIDGGKDFCLFINKSVLVEIGNLGYEENYKRVFNARVPTITYLIDNFVHHFAEMSLLPLPFEALLVADSNWIEPARMLGFEADSIFAEAPPTFLPMWGMPRAAGLGSADRDIDILFSGDIRSLDFLSRNIDSVTAGKACLKPLVHEAVEAINSCRGVKDPGVAFLDVVVRYQDCVAGLGIVEIQNMFSAIETYCRGLYRANALVSMDSSRVVVAGVVECADLLEKRNIVHLGRRSFNDVMALAGRSKMFLGDLAGFSGGIELRPSMAMQNGALYIGETNSYLREVAGDVFPHCPLTELDALAGRLRSKPSQLDDMAAAQGEFYDRMVGSHSVAYASVVERLISRSRR